MQAERLMNTFFDLVKIDSPSRKEAGVAHYCQHVLEDLGFTVCFDASNEQTGSETGNLVAWLSPKGAVATEAASENSPLLNGFESAPIVFTAHMDCVQPCGGVEPEVVKDSTLSDKGLLVRSKGETVLGSDDKAGVASILEAARCIIESGAPHKGIVIVFTVCEEIGCLGAKYLDQELFDYALAQVRKTTSERSTEGSVDSSSANSSSTSSAAFSSTPSEKAQSKGIIPCAVFDSDGAAGTIIVGAPYHYTFVAEITGRASHAGVEPEAGISAISIASDALARISWGRLDEATTSNIGRIKGGQVNNIVAQSCSVTGECRSLSRDRVEEVRAEITSAFEAAFEKFSPSNKENKAPFEAFIPENSQVKLNLEWTLEYPGFFYEESDKLIQFLSNAAKKAGLKPIYKTTGGGSDANVLASKGATPVVVGVGMTNFHTVDEYVLVEDLENSARFAEELMGI